MNNLNNTQTSDLVYEMGQNFIEYAVACNTDRAIPDATSGLKPVAKRIIYGAFDCGFSSAKPHVKCANIVGNVMADFHPHGDSSIYGALVRLSQSWTMRYPLLDFHGSNGNIDGDGPAHYRYTEARLSKLTEDGMLGGIKKKNVDFIPNYSETKNEPVTLPSIFPNLLCNPNSGIGVAMACNWLPHNLKEVANAIYDYMDGKEPNIPGPDFPTGGLIINQKDLANIIKTGKGSVKLRGKYNIEDNNIVFYEIPYGVATEALMSQIGELADNGEIVGIENIRNESNRKGYRLVIECEKGAYILRVITSLFAKTDLQVSISYNQVALIDKTPTEMGLKDCLKIYVNHNVDCITREAQFDKAKAEDKLDITEGLLKALEDIDNIITLIKSSDSANAAKTKLMAKYNFNENQAKAIIDMKLGRLANLEKVEIYKEKEELLALIDKFNTILNNPHAELRTRLQEIVRLYGDERRTEITQLTEDKATKEEKEIASVEPEKCVVIITESGLIKRVPAASFKAQKRAGKGVKSKDDIVDTIIRTNTIDQLMIFTDGGMMYRLLVNDIPVGSNTTKGVSISSLIELNAGETVQTIYSIYRETDAKYVLFITKNGTVKKTTLEEYLKTKKKTGIQALNFREGDSLAEVTLIKDEEMFIITRKGFVVRMRSTDISASGRLTVGVKGINLTDGDEVVAVLPIRDATDDLAVFSEYGIGKRIPIKEFTLQGRGTRGLMCYKITDATGNIAAATLVSDDDMVLVGGVPNSICIKGSDIARGSRSALGVQIIKGSKILSVSKV